VGSKVFLLDDLLATSGTLAAGETLIGNIDGVEVLANIVIWEIDFFHGRDKLHKPTHSIIHLE
jgi:adenine phosphoribosyltransferase